MKVHINTTWRADLAYVVGLITTDGCLSSNGRHIHFTSKDADLIKTFASILNLTNKISITKNKTSEIPRIQFGNVKFYRWLQEIGLTPNKSRTLGQIKVPDEFFADFLRGHLDGDGSITIYTDYHNTYKNPKYIYKRLFVRLISASKKHVEWLQEKIIALFGIRGRLHQTKPNIKSGNSMYILKFGKKDSKKFLARIYYSPFIPSLNRKRIQAEQFVSYNYTEAFI